MRAFERAGWELYRIRDRHHLLRVPDGRRTTVPVHANMTLPIGTIGDFIDPAGMSVDEFVALLRGKTG